MQNWPPETLEADRFIEINHCTVLIDGHALIPEARLS